MRQEQVVGGTAAAAAVEAPLFTRTYILVCLAGFLAYTNNAFLTPIMTPFITDLGATSGMVGLALATYNVMSFTLRPSIGRIVDAGYAREVTGFGSLFVAIGTMINTVAMLPVVFFSQLVQGSGWAGLNMGTYATVAALAPPRRRGEASGYFQMSLTTAGAVIPALSIWVLGLTNYRVVFVLAGLAGLLSAATAFSIRRLPHTPQKRASGLRGLFEPSVLLPSGLLFATNAAYPAAVFFIPLYGRQLQLESLWVYFLAQGLVSIVTQGGLGRISDRIGRAPTIAIGLAGAAVGLILLSVATNLVVLALGGALFTFGFGFNNPALFAMVMDRAPKEKLGAATATFTISFQAGKAVGSSVGGFLIAWIGFHGLYLVSALPLVAAFLFLLVARKRFSPKVESAAA